MFYRPYTLEARFPTLDLNPFSDRRSLSQIVRKPDSVEHMSLPNRVLAVREDSYSQILL